MAVCPWLGWGKVCGNEPGHEYITFSCTLGSCVACGSAPFMSACSWVGAVRSCVPFRACGMGRRPSLPQAWIRRVTQAAPNAELVREEQADLTEEWRLPVGPPSSLRLCPLPPDHTPRVLLCSVPDAEEMRGAQVDPDEEWMPPFGPVNGLRLRFLPPKPPAQPPAQLEESVSTLAASEKELLAAS